MIKHLRDRSFLKQAIKFYEPELIKSLYACFPDKMPLSENDVVDERTESKHLCFEKSQIVATLINMIVEELSNENIRNKTLTDQKKKNVIDASILLIKLDSNIVKHLNIKHRKKCQKIYLSMYKSFRVLKVIDTTKDRVLSTDMVDKIKSYLPYYRITPFLRETSVNFDKICMIRQNFINAIESQNALYVEKYLNGENGSLLAQGFNYDATRSDWDYYESARKLFTAIQSNHTSKAKLFWGELRGTKCGSKILYIAQKLASKSSNEALKSIFEAPPSNQPKAKP